MANTDLIEAWYRFMAEAVRETSDAQTFFDKYAKGQDPTEWLARWMKQHGAEEAPPAPDELPDEWMEQWYKTMGVVPRSRYLKLLERHEKLRQELDEARQKIERMAGTYDSDEQKKAAEDVMNVWKSTLDETMKAQSEWMRAFSGAASPSSDVDDDDEDASDEKAPPRE